MKQPIFILVLVFVNFCEARLAWRKRSIECPGNYKPGSQVTKGRYWYECNDDGFLQPMGCINNKEQVGFSCQYKVLRFASRSQFNFD